MIEREAGQLIEAIDEVHRKECRGWIPKRSLPKKKPTRKWEFSYEILGRNRNPRLFGNTALVGATLGIDLKNRPAILLWMHCRDTDEYIRIRKGLKNRAANAIEVWGYVDGKDCYILGEVPLRKQHGAFRTVSEIKGEYVDLVKKTLLKGMGYSLAAKLARGAKRKGKGEIHSR